MVVLSVKSLIVAKKESNIAKISKKLQDTILHRQDPNLVPFVVIFAEYNDDKIVKKAEKLRICF